MCLLDELLHTELVGSLPVTMACDLQVIDVQSFQISFRPLLLCSTPMPLRLVDLEGLALV